MRTRRGELWNISFKSPESWTRCCRSIGVSDRRAKTPDHHANRSVTNLALNLGPVCFATLEWSNEKRGISFSKKNNNAKSKTVVIGKTLDDLLQSGSFESLRSQALVYCKNVTMREARIHSKSGGEYLLEYAHHSFKCSKRRIYEKYLMDNLVDAIRYPF